MLSPSFGFSISGTKEQALKELEAVETAQRPPHAKKIKEHTKLMLNAMADNTTVSISINTHIEEAK